MKKFAAHFVFPISSLPIKKGIVETSDAGEVFQLNDLGENFKEEAGLEFHNGIICPEFVIPPSSFNPEEFFNYLNLPTDSASMNDFQNTKMILNLAKRMQLKNESIKLHDLLCIFTFEMAKINQLEDKLGSIEINKKPGLILISGIDYKNMKLTNNSSLKKLI